jgi:hypothetical protein
MSNPLASIVCHSCGAKFSARVKSCTRCGSPMSELDLAPGDVIDGRYEIVSLLGIGGMGEVFKVLHGDLQAFRTIKVMRKELLTDEPALPLELDASAREVLTEVGNVLLNACIGSFGNLLKVPVGFSVPDLDVAQLQEIIERFSSGGDAFRFALVVTSAFRLRDSEVTGFVVIVLTVQSLTRLLIALDAWERTQG